MGYFCSKYIQESLFWCFLRSGFFILAGGTTNTENETEEAAYLKTGNNEFERLLLFNPIISRLFEVAVGGSFGVLQCFRT